MNYKIDGEQGNPLMVFITGAGIGPHMWDAQVEYFKAYRRLTFNLPGHGDNSDQTFETIESVGNWIREIILKERNDGKAIVIGHSIGAQIVMWMLANAEESLSHAVVISGLNKKMPMLNWLIKPMAYSSMPLVKYRWFAKAQAKELRLPDQMFESYFNDTQLISKTTLAHIMTENMNFELELLPGSKVKSLVIVGGQEKGIMIKSAEKTTHNLGLEGYYRFEEAAHGIPYEMPEALNQLVEGFIESEDIDTEIKGVRRCR